MTKFHEAIIGGWLLWDSAGFFEWLTNQPWYFQVLEAWVAAIPIESHEQGLEVGCGPGFLTAHLQRQGLRIQGLDRSPQMLSRARRMSPTGIFIEGDALDMPLEDAVADVVFAASVVNVVPSPEKLVSEMARVARPGGRVSVLFPTPSLSHGAPVVADQRGLAGLSAAALSFWGKRASKCEPNEIVTLFASAGLQNPRVDLFLDGNVASVTGRVG